MEGCADRVCCFHMTLVPGLLQTRAYAEAVIRNAAEPEASESMIDRWVELRLSRQEVLSKERPLTINVVIDESVVRRRVGGLQVLRDQLSHLVKLQALPQVRIQIMPSSVALHQGLDGTFWIFHLPEPYPAVAYVESLGGRLYMESPKAERFLHAYDRLSKSALSKDESTALMGAIAEELT
ncbi:DUF5753 domain-containing protein [Micromonospora sp. WMMD714]|nr:DUF5753 domain-containing protein [Micromonospora sp. WMMD714]WFE67525.1 DUF5753 domain-containing protein [Micromonospora sp. WMMD714]